MQNLKTLALAIIFNGFWVQAQLPKQLDSVAKAYAAKDFNGNVLFSKNDSILFLGSYGNANFEDKLPLEADSVFELASVSKQFTALAIMQLIERKQLSLDTKVVEIMEHFPYREISIEHLLRHQSGLPGYQGYLADKKFWNPKIMATNADLVRLLAQYRPELRFAPGSQYEYNNTGYALLASIIARTSGLTFGEYLKENVFGPAKMNHSGVYGGGDKRAQFAKVAEAYTPKKGHKGFQKVEKDKKRRSVQWSKGVVGDRGVYTSVLDLEKWKQALRYNRLISETSKRQMFSVDTVSKKYGYGFAIYETQSKGKWVYHNGSWSGYKTSAIYLPEHNEYLVILSNNRFNETYRSFEDDLYQLIKSYAYP